MTRPCSPAVLALLLLGSTVARADDRVDFNRDVRPLLSDTCFHCHGPDDKTREAELRLDEKESLFADRGGYAAVVPKKPEASEIVKRLTTDDPELQMPPAGFKKSLSPEQVDVVRRWIEQGADWKGHWAYVPPSNPAPPTVQDAHGFVRSEIDRFVYARLLEKGLVPSPEADKVTLARRLSFDLRGLPPTVEEVDAFLADESPDAYEKLVDRFLASDHFGERMAVDWLDLVRYADSIGYHSDNPRDVWLYRDYVIRSFNENKPFDEFTIEQLAGDLLPNATRSQRIASGYNRLLQTTQEGGAQAKEYTAKYTADRVRNVSSVWLGSTMGCSECHDHKFDPFTAADFYAMGAFFADVQETPVGRQGPTMLPTTEQQAELDRFDGERRRLQTVLDTQTPELDAELAEWESSPEARFDPWTTTRPREVVASEGVSTEELVDGFVGVEVRSPEADEAAPRTTTFTVASHLAGVTALRLEVLPNDEPAGVFEVTEISVQQGGKPVKPRATASHADGGHDVGKAFDGNVGTSWSLKSNPAKPSEAVLELPAPVAVSPDQPVTVTVKWAGDWSGRVRLAATAQKKPVNVGNDGRPPIDVRTIVATPPEARTDADRKRLAAYFRGFAPSLDPVRGELAKVNKQKADYVKTVPVSLVTTAVRPRTVRVLPRGNWLDDSGPVVDPAVPEFLGRLEVDGRATRLDLARWIVDENNPLTARVVVNRLWKQCFGRGLTALEDFGSQGEWPTHPELLDWLAVDLVRHDWDVKRTLKSIVMSGAYRQSSVADDELRSKDPYNKWLARQSRYRVPAELVRDNALAVSGLLNPTIGGPSVKPYQPTGYWKHLNFPKRTWSHDANENQYRRGLYTFWQRSFLHPSLLAFDAPSREECVVQRPRSNNPLQALVLLNDPTYVEASRAFAERIVDQGGESDESRLRFAFRTTLLRQPSDRELSVLSDLLKEQLTTYQADEAAAKAFLSVGQRPLPENANAAELAAWTAVARTLLNLHETITRS